ncbi:MAG: class I SAM-dependent rRNA methyltransferase [Myxococcales bacterium]|nr:class I SAM-dependent rRNA methyltransferase [Myxococcales bacterium]
MAVVSARAAQKLRRHNPWCYRAELRRSPETSERGAAVTVVDPQGNLIGQALYSQGSQLALRLLTRKGPREEAIDEGFFRRRLEAAIDRRRTLASREALRLVHGESDLLPGLFVDRYGHALVMQCLSEGMDARKELLARLLAELTGAPDILGRDDGAGRDFEGLPREVRVLSGRPEKAHFREGENRFAVDLREDFKTGSFLDQADNHLRAGELGRGEALDAFSYHGGFALSLAVKCERVIAVEQEKRAAARAKENAAENGRANVEVMNANAFDVLKGLDREGRLFDVVVLDPPAFAKRKEGLDAALRAYHELNLRALRILRPEGLLVSCSCSGKLTRDAFERMFREAADDAKRPVQILERRGAGIDHPVLSSLPETDYLKAFFVRPLG